MTDKGAKAILRDALECLEEYQRYGEHMRKIGRGFHPCGISGDSIDGVIARVRLLLDQSMDFPGVSAA